MQRRHAFTLIEVLIVIVLLAVLVGLLLPAVQRVRESANRSSCFHNLKEVALAIHGYLEVNQVLPSTKRIGPTSIPTSWTIRALSYIEQGNLYKAYDPAQSWDSPANRAVVSTRIKVLECPSNPNQGILDGSQATSPPWDPPFAACSDYAASIGVWNPARGQGANGAMPWDRQNKMTDISDGASNTILLVEIAGRPLVYQTGQVLGPYSAENRVNGGGWARPTSDYQLIGSSPDGVTFPGPCVMNCTTGPNCSPAFFPHPILGTQPSTQVYSFHPGGANAAFCDGSVRFLHDSIGLTTFATLVTRNGNETMTPLD